MKGPTPPLALLSVFTLSGAAAQDDSGAYYLGAQALRSLGGRHALAASLRLR